LVEAKNHKAPQESPAVRPRTPSSAPSELQPPAGEPAYTEVVDTPHVDTASGPLSGTHPPVTMIPPHHHPTNHSAPCLRL